jgi:DNA-binding response OmpR family regulator
MYRILLCEDNLIPLVDSEFVSYDVDVAKSADEILNFTYEKKYNLYIVNFFYYSVIEELKEASDETTTIFIDEYYNIYNLKKALLVGDDYLVKPLNFEEVKARVGYHYKKLYKHTKNIIAYKEFFFHIKTKQLYKNSDKVRLSPNEAKLLQMFLHNIDKPLIKDIIYEYLNITDGSLRVYISKLHKIGFDISYERANLSYTLNS